MKLRLPDYAGSGSIIRCDGEISSSLSLARVLVEVVSSAAAVALIATACSSSHPTQPSNTPIPTPSVASGPIVIGSPVLVSPANLTFTNGYPTLTVNNAMRSGPVGSIVYRFEISTYYIEPFEQIAVTSTVSETPNQTSFTPPAGTAPPLKPVVQWRVTAIDQTTAISSPPSASWSFFYSDGTPQGNAAAKLGFFIWPPGVQPPGTTGHARLGDNWPDHWTLFCNEATILVQEFQIFDLLDRGLDPQGAIDWMHSHGYPIEAAYYPSKNVIGFASGYLALINGRWDRIVRPECLRQFDW